MTPSQLQRGSRLVAAASGAAVFAFCMGLAVISGWWAHIELLKRVLPGTIAMNPLTAVGFTIAGLSLALRIRSSAGSGWQRTGRLLSMALLALGLLKLTFYATGWDFPLDQLLFPEDLADTGPVPVNRVAPNTALCLVMAGIALWNLDVTTKRNHRPSEYLAMGVAMVALLALLGYIYQVSWFYGLAARIPMAVHTSVTFLVLATGISFARPHVGLMSVVSADGPGGLLARRMFPAMILLFVSAGALRLLGEQKGLYEAELGVAIYTALSIGIMGGFMLWTARTLYLGDEERKRVRAERERFFALSLDMLCIAGTDGYFKRVNPAFTRVLGYTSDELTSRPLEDFIHPDDVARTREEIKTLGGGSPSLHFENRYRCKDGSWKWLEWNTQPYVEESILYAVGRDVTLQKEASGAILELNAELRRQTAQLEGLNHELESFSYSVSHDLRAPLRGISGFAEALEEHAGDSLDATSHGYLNRVRNAASRMGELIDDLLKLSRLTRAEFVTDTVDLSATANSILAELRSTDPHRRVETIVAPAIRVTGDSTLLRVLLENLLGNAWKFSSKTPEARIEMGTEIGPDGRIWCYIRDNGAGFDNRYAHKLFGAFQRLHSQSEFPGTGIGLATVQRIINRHGWEVRAEGLIDHGATFRFTLGENPENKQS